MAQRHDDQHSGREWRDRDRQRDPMHPYGQREPYNTGPSDYRRNESRYSESQYGQRRPWRDPTGRDFGGGGFRSRGDDYSWRGREYTSGGSEFGEGGGEFAAGGDYGSLRGSADFDYERGERGQPERGAGPFADTSESPRFFGAGNYSEGGAHFTGGYDQRGNQSAYSSGDYGYDRYARGQRPFKRGPKGYQRSDERLKEDISERLMQSDHVDSSDVTVNVVAGKVTLEGAVPSRYMKHYIEDLADGCPGVQDIENRIRVK
jgi:hypothetical protein